MKKKLILAALLAAALCVPTFAKSVVGKVSGVSVADGTVTLTVQAGNVNPFAEGGFEPSGEAVTEALPLDVAVEVYAPGKPQLSQGGRPVRVQPELIDVKRLGIDELVCIVYADDGSTVEKILVQAHRRPWDSGCFTLQNGAPCDGPIPPQMMRDDRTDGASRMNGSRYR